jgi:hypothetical protein
MNIAPHFGDDRRKDRRIRLRPITMAIENVGYSTMDWGFGGFSIEGYQGNRKVGDFVTATIIINDGEKYVENITKARIVRIEDKTRRLAAAFGSLDIKILSSWLTGRLVRTGRSVGGRRITDQPTVTSTASSFSRISAGIAVDRRLS